MPEQPGQPKEGWPMSWVAASIAVFIIGYTFVSLEFRKVNQPYEPYHDLKERGQAHELLKAGYQRIIVPATLPTQGGSVVPTASAVAVPGGIPKNLEEKLFTQPQLPATCHDVQAAAQTPRLLPYPILFNCVFGNDHQQLSKAALYVHGQTIFIVPECESLDGELATRQRDNLVQLTVPAGSLKAGSYQVTLIGAQSSLSWPLQVH